LIKILDPTNKGKIYFNNFVAAIKKLTSTSSTTTSTTESAQQNIDLLINVNYGDDKIVNKPSHVSIDNMFNIDRKSNPISPSYSNDTFNEYDTDSAQLNAYLKQNERTNNNRVITSASNSSNLTDLLCSMDDTNNSSNGEISYASLSFDLL
jgi:hypothetical protein